METLLPGIIMSFREGLEAFLIIAIIINFLNKTGNGALKRSVYAGFASSVVISVLFGLGLFSVARSFNAVDSAGKIWESAVSLIAVALIVTFIVWIIRHGAAIKGYVENRTSLHLSAWGILLLTIVLISREGVEIAIFSFAGKYTLASIAIGITAAGVAAALIFLSLVRVNLRAVFGVSLAYLILQCGYLAGYGLHEGLSALKASSVLPADSGLLTKLFDLSATPLNHKEGALGIALNVLLGWYSKPEVIQFALQYLVTGVLFAYWFLSGDGKPKGKQS